MKRYVDKIMVVIEKRNTGEIPITATTFTTIQSFETSELNNENIKYRIINSMIKQYGESVFYDMLRITISFVVDGQKISFVESDQNSIRVDFTQDELISYLSAFRAVKKHLEQELSKLNEDYEWLINSDELTLEIDEQPFNAQELSDLIKNISDELKLVTKKYDEMKKLNDKLW